MTKKNDFAVNLIPARWTLSKIRYKFERIAPNIQKEKEFFKTLFAGLDKAHKDNINKGFLK